MPKPKKLIEVAMPVKEISAESVRDKSIRHGHISTLHLWWARRPLPVCRAVVFASLVPDPLDPACPSAFVEAVKLLLGPDGPMPGDPYKPYADVPWTSVHDPVEDNPRNRLQAFIGRFSSAMEEHLLRGKKAPAPAQQLSDASMIKWESKNDERILGIARKLIWVAYNAEASKQTAAALITDFEVHYTAIKSAETTLYSIPDRHIETQEVQQATASLEVAIEAFLDKMPRVFDPFAGGGAIPLEAARLGCRSFGNDINPVAHIIQKGSLEFPQRFGKPVTYSKREFIQRYDKQAWDEASVADKLVVQGDAKAIRIPNRLAHDVKYYAQKMMQESECNVSHLYPINTNGNRPIAYYWVRVGICSNPSCRAEVPLLKQFYLSKKRSAKPKDYTYLQPVINGRQITFEIAHGECKIEGWNQRANLNCPVCGSFTDTKSLKKQFVEQRTSERMIAVIEDINGTKTYRTPTEFEINSFSSIPTANKPQELMPKNDSQNIKVPLWGFQSFGDLFNTRQLSTINSLLESLHKIEKRVLEDVEIEYAKSIIVYLSLLIDRIIARSNSFCLWHILQETVEHPFGRQALPMVFDYPEINPFNTLTAGAAGQLSYVLKYIEEESNLFACTCINSASGEKEQFEKGYLTCVITDPPYYDAIAYADLSDFFYIWLKRSLSGSYPLVFSTPLTPKADECTAIKHQHQGDSKKAKDHFEKKLSEIFDALEHQTSELVSIMFAHQSTAAWTTLCNSILGARMNITGSWAVDTEVTGALKTGMAVLASSITVCCRPTQRMGSGDFKDVRQAIEIRVREEVSNLYALGFRGADLLTACFGQAVSEFGRYKTVEKADGSEVTVAELLVMARDAAFNALVKDFPGDQFTKFYIGWLQLYGFTESEHDDVARLSQVGLSIAVNDIVRHNLLIKNGNKETLADFEQRVANNKKLGYSAESLLIDKVHRAMALTKGSRTQLLDYLADVAAEAEAPFWRALTGIAELTKGSKDGEVANDLLVNKDSLIRESVQARKEAPAQTKMFE